MGDLKRRYRQQKRELSRLKGILAAAAVQPHAGPSQQQQQQRLPAAAAELSGSGDAAAAADAGSTGVATAVAAAAAASAAAATATPEMQAKAAAEAAEEEIRRLESLQRKADAKFRASRKEIAAAVDKYRAGVVNDYLSQQALAIRPGALELPRQLLEKIQQYKEQVQREQKDEYENVSVYGVVDIDQCSVVCGCLMLPFGCLLTVLSVHSPNVADTALQAAQLHPAAVEVRYAGVYCPAIAHRLL
jgi:hypothetical protein